MEKDCISSHFFPESNQANLLFGVPREVIFFAFPMSAIIGWALQQASGWDLVPWFFAVLFSDASSKEQEDIPRRIQAGTRVSIVQEGSDTYQDI